MPWISPSEISAEDAVAFCAAVQAREEMRLAELASWVSSTRGPLSKLDASVESLEWLWRWAIRFADRGFPGIPETAHGQWFVPKEGQELSGVGRLGYFA